MSPASEFQMTVNIETAWVKPNQNGDGADHVSVWPPVLIQAAAFVLCNLADHGESKPPCPRHVAAATYALAAVARVGEKMETGPGFRRDDLFSRYSDYAQVDLGNRTWWRIERRDHHSPDPPISWWQRRWGRFRMNDYGRRKKSSVTHGELVSSLCSDGFHMPALDVDLQASLFPSTTEGHYHLYINRRLPWPRYRRFLRACKRAGIIEPGYYRAAVRRRATYLWRPGLYKRNEETS